MPFLRVEQGRWLGLCWRKRKVGKRSGMQPPVLHDPLEKGPCGAGIRLDGVDRAWLASRAGGLRHPGEPVRHLCRGDLVEPIAGVLRKQIVPQESQGLPMPFQRFGTAVLVCLLVQVGLDRLFNRRLGWRAVPAWASARST